MGKRQSWTAVVSLLVVAIVIFVLIDNSIKNKEDSSVVSVVKADGLRSTEPTQTPTLSLTQVKPQGHTYLANEIRRRFSAVTSVSVTCGFEKCLLDLVVDTTDAAKLHQLGRLKDGEIGVALAESGYKLADAAEMQAIDENSATIKQSFYNE